MTSQLPVFPEEEYKDYSSILIGRHSTVLKAINITTGKQHILKIAERHSDHAISEVKIGRILTKRFGVKHLECVRELFSYRGRVAGLGNFVSGITLQEYLSTRNFILGKVSHEFRLFMQLLEGVAYTHACGVAHRDIKPQNMILGGDVLKVIDFGFAACLEVNPEAFGHFVGTPNYSAPEIWESKRYWDLDLEDKLELFTAADVYSCGVIGCQLFWNKLPTEGIKEMKNLGKVVVDGRIEIPQEPKYLRDLVSCMLTTDYTQRMSVSEVIKIVYGTPVPSIPQHSLCLLLEAVPEEVSPQAVAGIFSFL